jgi:KipI family sensor histidine kinase inhibitor
MEIPVRFDADCGPDLEFVASLRNLDPEDVVRIFTERTYRVYMLGFLPGFAYLGEIDARLAAPRKDSPRLRVPRGSVGIAGRQTGVYPFASPGGWQIIGRTETEFLTPDGATPTLLQPGDTVRFYPTQS